ncbi:MAG TPA: radical SAM protein, partial [Elusimicrobiota bacterium]|nr:radical SAM protein [Elusimicrobiota bacterium]
QAGRSELAALARAGVREIQPGIETFSTRLLAAAGKGVTAAQNVVFMKWARHYGIDLRYYLLHGFPGETEADFERVLTLLPRLRHLAPPLRLRRLALTRGSPYFDFPERYGIRKVRPYPEYAAALPEAPLDWSRAAQSFDHELPGERALAGHARRLGEEVARWRALWSGPRPPALELRRGEGFVELVDARAGNGRRDASRWDGDAAWAYLACGDAPMSREELLRAARAEGRTLDPGALSRALETFDERGLVWREGKSFFALALPYRTGFREYDILSVRRPRGDASVEPFREERA